MNQDFKTDIPLYVNDRFQRETSILRGHLKSIQYVLSKPVIVDKKKPRVGLESIISIVAMVSNLGIDALMPLRMELIEYITDEIKVIPSMISNSVEINLLHSIKAEGGQTSRLDERKHHEWKMTNIIRFHEVPISEWLHEEIEMERVTIWSDLYSLAARVVRFIGSDPELVFKMVSGVADVVQRTKQKDDKKPKIDEI